ncbi:MAG: heliorhodopsin HeR [Bacilli bacterium]
METQIAQKKFTSLKRFNLVMGVLHLLQGIMMLTLSLVWDKITSFTPAIYGSFLSFNSILGRLVTVQDELFLLPFGILVSLFFFLSSFFHLLVSAIPAVEKVYIAGLQKNTNSFRWIEYSLSSSLMIMLIAVLFGINDLYTLLLIFGLNAAMNLFGLLMEKMNSGKPKINWIPFIFGAIVGILPWIIIIISGFARADLSQIPWFIYAIFVSYFILFNCFPINMILQYKGIGKWKDYLYGEKVYIILSLVAKTLLAWFVLFGVMQPK